MDDTVRDLEARFPGFQIQYSDGVYPFEWGAGFYASRDNGMTVFFAETAEELSQVLQEQG